jgi:outer membrane receptor protein involved in Fe transport
LNSENEINRYGFESEISGALPFDISYYFNISYVDGDQMDLIPHWKSNLLFGIPIKDRFNFIYYMDYFGKRQRASDDNRDDLDPVLLNNLSVTADLVKDRLKFRLDVRNLFDEDYESPDPSGRVIDDYPMSGRYIFGSFQLKMSFGSK